MPESSALSRRAFVGLSATALAALALPRWTWADTQAAQNGAIVIVHTNDVHCAYEQAVSSSTGALSCFGYEGFAGYAAELRDSFSNVALVDAGDAVQGQAAGTLSQGEYLIDIMNACEYDVVIPGNHEFDFGMDQFSKLVQKANTIYLSCNFTDLRTGNLIFPAYVVKDYTVGADAAGQPISKRVAYVGVTTPATLTSCSPTSFKEGGEPEGATIYGFCEDDTGDALCEAVQAAVDAALAAGADYVVLLAHLGQTGAPDRWRSDVVAANTTGIDVIIDGHSHEQYVQVATNNVGKNVVITQTGTQFAGMGCVIIDPASDTVTATTGSLHEQAVTTHCTGAVGADSQVVTTSDVTAEQAAAWAASEGATQVAAAVSTVAAEVKAVTDAVVGTSKVDLMSTVSDTDTNWAVRLHETNAGDFVTDAYWNFAYQAGANPDCALVNGGCLRWNIYKGDVTNGDLINLNPFNNQLCYTTLTGQELLDVLEMAVRKLPASSGSFPQVSSLRFTVRTDIDSSVVTDDSGLFVKVDGEYRVRNVTVGTKALDLNATYTLAAHSYWLVDCGDGMSMFSGKDVTFLGVDNQALLEYIKVLGGEIPEDYANVAGDGRITLQDGPDPEPEPEPEPEPVVPVPDEDTDASQTGTDGPKSHLAKTDDGLAAAFAAAGISALAAATVAVKAVAEAGLELTDCD